MTLEIIVFIAAILFGIVWYWRESRTNAMYRFLNRILNSKELQMKASDKKGFVFEQAFLLRLVFITILFLIGILVTRFLIPIGVAEISVFASMIIGTLIGTYLAGLIFKSSKILNEQSDAVENVFNKTVEKGKEFVNDIKGEAKETIEVEKPTKEAPKAPEKSARERLKDKGLL